MSGKLGVSVGYQRIKSQSFIVFDHEAINLRSQLSDEGGKALPPRVKMCVEFLFCNELSVSADLCTSRGLTLDDWHVQEHTLNSFSNRGFLRSIISRKAVFAEKSFDFDFKQYFFFFLTPVSEET